jgi:hypothetical protein
MERNLLRFHKSLIICDAYGMIFPDRIREEHRYDELELVTEGADTTEAGYLR